MLIFFASALAFIPFNQDVSDLSGDPLGLSIDAAPQTRVVGGAPAEPGAWPSTVALIAEGGYPICTGTLIDDDVVLTAAHCVVGQNIVEVITGASDIATDGTWIEVSAQHIHPSYSAEGGSDLALLELRSPSPDPAISIASGCLAEQRVQDGSNAAIVGFGVISADGEQATTRLHQAFSTIADADCSEDLVDGQYTSCDPDLRPDSRELFAGGDGVDACFGDSGGPLYISDEYDQWYLAGVTSRGARGSNGEACGGGGVWVRPDAHLEWIEAELDRSLPRPTCQAPVDAPEFGPPPIAEGTGWRVVGDILRVKPGAQATLQLRVESSDPSELRFELLSQGSLGSATVDADGLITYQAESGSVGADLITVKVTDATGAAASLELDVEIGGGLGCSTAGSGPLWMAGVGLVLAGRRRRRS